MFNGELVVQQSYYKRGDKIPRDFHYLKVVKLNDGDYKLTFCNISGNELF